MKITTPQMGTVKYMISDLVERLGTEYEAPPSTTAKTMELGSRYSPEFSCLPLKITLGNFIEALENGAEMLVMAGGCGPCRFGYYAEIHKSILKDLGYDFDMAVVEPPRAYPIKFIKACKKLAPGRSLREIWKAVGISFKKAQLIDLLDKKVLQLRAYELEEGSVDEAYKKALEMAKSAFSAEEIGKAKEQTLKIFDEVPVDMERDILKVGLVGEFYIMLEPVVNFNVERWLGARNVYIERGVYTSDWIGPGKDNPVAGVKDAVIRKAASKYLAHHVGGEGQVTIGHVVHFSEIGFDGVIHMFPFTCMPETIAKSILPKVSQDLDFPVLSLVIDEQTGEAGVITRLEAMLDLMWSRREKRKNTAKERDKCAVI